MPWSKLDDGLHENAKIATMSDKAFRLYICAITYSARHRLTGSLTFAHVTVLFRLTGAKQKQADELVAIKAWDEMEGGYRIHDHEVYNPSQEEISQKRAEAGRIGGIKSAETRASKPSKPEANASRLLQVASSKPEANLKQMSSKGTCAQTRGGIPDPDPDPKGHSRPPSASRPREWPYEEPPVSSQPMHALWRMEGVGGIIAATQGDMGRELVAIKKHLTLGSEDELVKYFKYQLTRNSDFAAPSRWGPGFATDIIKHRAGSNGNLVEVEKHVKPPKYDEFIQRQKASQ